MWPLRRVAILIVWSVTRGRLRKNIVKSNNNLYTTGEGVGIGIKCPVVNEAHEASMISRDDKIILDDFSTGVRERFPRARIWAFGSRVTGSATWESDFDVCVVLDHLDDRAQRHIRDVAWDVGFKHGRVITTVTLDSEQFERGPMSESTLVENIRQQGIAA